MKDYVIDCLSLIRQNSKCYIYFDDVLEETIKECEKRGYKYKVIVCDGYYLIEGEKNEGKKRKKNKLSNTNAN